jgi:hypothetical protein
MPGYAGIEGRTTKPKLPGGFERNAAEMLGFGLIGRCPVGM